MLIVDDSADTREMYAEYLKLSGFRVAQASNGLDAIAVAEQSDPDVILLDLSMPGLDGWEVIRRLRDNQKTNRAKIVVLSGREDTPAGAVTYDAFLVKPCLPDDLARELRRVLDS